MMRETSGPSVIMFGPSPDARGGIASVASVLLAEPTLTRFDIEYVSTWTEGDRLRRAGVALSAIFRALTMPRRGSVMHIHMASRGSFCRKAAIIAAARVRGARVLVQLHGGEFHTFFAESPRWMSLLVRLVFRKADVVAVLSPVWQRRIKDMTGRSDAIVIPNPVRIPNSASEMCNAPMVLFLGRLGEQKGTRDLLDAIGLLQQQGYGDVRWLLAGDGDLEKWRERALHLPLPDRIAMPGWLSREEADQALADAWIFCLPSYDEGKPMALLEAMSHGLACVATPVGGVPDIIVNEETGLLVPPGDATTLAAALERLISSREMCMRIGAHARDLVSRECSSAKVGSVIANLYDGLLSGQHR